MCKSKKHAWHQTMCVHGCTRVYNKCTTHTHLFIRSICHEMNLLTTSSALSFIIYTCRTILGGIVTDILGHPRHTAFVAPCSQLGMYVAHTYNYSQLYSYNLCTTFLNQTSASHRPAGTWFLKIDPVQIVGMRACVCLCSHPTLLITSDVIQIPCDWFKKFYSCYMATVVNGCDPWNGTHRRH